MQCYAGSPRNTGLRGVLIGALARAPKARKLGSGEVFTSQLPYQRAKHATPSRALRGMRDNQLAFEYDSSPGSARKFGRLRKVRRLLQ